MFPSSILFKQKRITGDKVLFQDLMLAAERLISIHVCSRLARFLTDQENHRTQSEYETGFLVKAPHCTSSIAAETVFPAFCSRYFCLYIESCKSAGSGAQVHELIFRSVLRCFLQGVPSLEKLPQFQCANCQQETHVVTEASDPFLRADGVPQSLCGKLH